MAVGAGLASALLTLKGAEVVDIFCHGVYFKSHFQKANSSHRIMEINLSRNFANKTLRFLLFIGLFLTLSSFSAQFIYRYMLIKEDFSQDHIVMSGFVWLFNRLMNVDGENNIPTWYSSILLFLTALILAAIALHKRQRKDKFFIHWLSLSFLFILMSIDEMSLIHEVTIIPLRVAFDANGFFYFTWVVPALFILGIAGVTFSKFLINLPKKSRDLFIISAIVYFGGAVGMEMVGGQIVSVFGEQSILYPVSVHIEEFLEMSGAILFIYTLLLYAAAEIKKLEINI